LSSILRALKKLEEDSMPQEGQTHEQKIKMRQMVIRRAKAPRVIIRFFSILLTILLVGTAVLIIMKSNGKHSITITKKQDTFPQRRPLTHLPQQPSTLKKELKKESSKESIPPAIIVKQSKPSTISASSEGERNPQPGQVGERIQATAGKTIDQQTNHQKELVKEDKHPEFILTGILWSDIPGRRVALINNRYLREGEKINGVSVIQIKRKEVTLQSGEEKWDIRVKK
jgi:hypothetical protein